MNESGYTIHPIGVVRSELKSREDAPMQGYEGAPDAWIEIAPEVAAGLDGVEAGSDVILLTWLHQAERDTLLVHPRGNPDAPLTGVFATRSPDRPNPIGLHRVTVLEVNRRKLRVKPLEAIDGTPVVDIKAVLGAVDDR
jgi:tRNA-Thr(GGU) m(6)t(6)A37 methyltransferase TsaA